MNRPAMKESERKRNAATYGTRSEESEGIACQPRVNM